MELLTDIRYAVDRIMDQYKKNNNKFSGEDWQEIARIVEIIPAVPNLPLPLFIPVMSKNVPASVELGIVRSGKVLLVKRSFYGETAYHTPGTYVAPGESFMEATQRCADRELGVRIISAQTIMAFSQKTNPRFHDCSVLLRCEIEGEPRIGEWFDRCPPMLAHHQQFLQHLLPDR